MKTNARAAGVDGRTVAQTAELLAARQEDILALISAGRYRPEAVKAVDIPKVNGGTRRLGIPTVLDRPIQKAVHQTLDMCVPSRLPPRIRPTTCSWRLLSTNGRRPPLAVLAPQQAPLPFHHLISVGEHRLPAHFRHRQDLRHTFLSLLRSFSHSPVSVCRSYVYVEIQSEAE